MESERPSFDGLLQHVTQLPNGELTQQLRLLNEQECVGDAELLLYLSELDQRGLYRQEAVSSLFDFCVSRLGCSEDVAWKRVGAARLMRRFPLVFDLLCTGQIHLSALMLVKPHLTEENYQEWLLAASGKSKRQVEMLIARRCPKPDVATSVRKLPEPRRTSTAPSRDAASANAAHCLGLQPITYPAPMRSRLRELRRFLALAIESHLQPASAGNRSSSALASSQATSYRRQIWQGCSNAHSIS